MVFHLNFNTNDYEPHNTNTNTNTIASMYHIHDWIDQKEKRNEKDENEC